MRYRYFLGSLYLIVFVVIVTSALSDFAFGTTGFKKLGARLFVAVFWPFAIMSTAGRQFIFNTGEGI